MAYSSGERVFDMFSVLTLILWMFFFFNWEQSVLYRVLNIKGVEFVVKEKQWFHGWQSIVCNTPILKQ